MYYLNGVELYIYIFFCCTSLSVTYIFQYIILILDYIIVYFNISLYMYNIYLNISNGSFIYHWQYYIYVCNNQIYPRLIHTQIMTRGMACARIYMLMLVHKYVLVVVTRKSSLYSLYYIIVAALLCFISTFFLYCFVLRLSEIITNVILHFVC